MWYLFLQIWVWLIAAFVLGWFAHWFFCCRGKEQNDRSQISSLFDTDANTIDEAKAVDT